MYVFLRLLIDALEKSLKRTKGENLCKSLYVGTVVNQIHCYKCKRVSERAEQFYDLNLQIADCKNLILALRKYCCGEVLEGDSSYQCDNCQSKQRALRSSVIRKIPNILTFSCNRFKIDKSTNWMRVKLTSRWEFPLVINMASFSEKNGKINEAEFDKVEEDNFVSSLEKESLNMNVIIEAAKVIATNLAEKYKKSFRFDELADEERECIRVELLQSVHFYDIVNKSDNNYLLHSVIIHRGSAYSGHYYAYIRDNLNEGKWVLNKEVIPNVGSHVITTQSDISSIKDGKDMVTTQTTVTTLDEGEKEEVPKCNYFFDKQKKELVINEFSPEGMIIKAMSNQLKSVNTGNANKRKKAKVSHAKLSTSLENVQKAISRLRSGNWNETYQSAYGSIESHVKRLHNLFDYNDSTITIKYDNIKITTLSDFKKSFIANKGISQVITTSGNIAPQEVDIISVDDDEELARSIQSQYYLDETVDIVETNVGSVDNGWEVAGSKKKEKKSKNDDNNKNIQKSQSNKNVSKKNVKEVIDLSHETNSVPNSTTISDENNHLDTLTNDIVSFCFGNYFEFNDSIITPLPLSTLEKSFEGENSAYLLVYRKINIDNESGIIEVNIDLCYII